jgi:uncharacterized protein YhbP (UPF0306 family)
MLSSNRFLTLATADPEGPWATPINYVVGPGEYLHFYSAVESLHSRAIGNANDVAIAIFDSKASSEDVDGMQSRARCTVVTHTDLPTVHEHYFRVNFSSDEDRAWWYRPAEEFEEPSIWRFYRLALIEAWVIDFDSIEQERVDRRLPVDLAGIWT